MKTEYASLLERRADFLKEHSPGAEVEEYTADLLLIDYYTALFGNAISQAADGKDVSGYKALLPELDPVFSGKTVFPVCFRLPRMYICSFILSIPEEKKVILI